MVKNLQVEEA